MAAPYLGSEESSYTDELYWRVARQHGTEGVHRAFLSSDWVSGPSSEFLHGLLTGWKGTSCKGVWGLCFSVRGSVPISQRIGKGQAWKSSWEWEWPNPDRQRYEEWGSFLCFKGWWDTIVFSLCSGHWAPHAWNRGSSRALACHYDLRVKLSLWPQKGPEVLYL